MPKSIDYYLSQGFSPKAAAYFAGGRRRITAVSPEGATKLLLTFDNGERRRYDVSPHLRPGTVFEPLMQPEIFGRVFLSEDHVVSWDLDPAIDSSIHWSNRVDLCPDTCYIDSVPVS